MFARVGQPTWLHCGAVCGGGSEREQCCLLCSLLAFSHFPRYPQANWALLVLVPGWVVCVHPRTLWVSPTSSPVRLGVSPATSTLTGVCSQWFEALFPRWSPGLWVCLAPHLFLPGYLHVNVGPPLCQLPLTTSPLCPTACLRPSCRSGCFFLNSLVVGLPNSLIFCQFRLFFVFKFVVVLLLVV